MVEVTTSDRRLMRGWTPSAVQLAGLIGVPAVLKLVRRYGGQRIHVPKRPGPGSALARAIGHEAAARLGREWSGDRLYVPMLAAAGAKKAKIAEAKGTVVGIARRFGVTERWARRVLSEGRAMAKNAVGEVEKWQATCARLRDKLEDAKAALEDVRTKRRGGLLAAKTGSDDQAVAELARQAGEIDTHQREIGDLTEALEDAEAKLGAAEERQAECARVRRQARVAELDEEATAAAYEVDQALAAAAVKLSRCRQLLGEADDLRRLDGERPRAARAGRDGFLGALEHHGLAPAHSVHSTFKRPFAEGVGRD